MNDSDYALKWAKKMRAVKLLGGQCRHCGESNIFVLDFHHPGQKGNQVGKMLKDLRGWPELEKEVLKCELLCSNCHIEHHHPMGSGRTAALKASVINMLGNPVCCCCGKLRENLASLDFHHYKGLKEFHISDVFARKRSVGLQCLFDEIAKCKILCRNCHIKMRIDIKRFARLRDSINEKMQNHCPQRQVDADAILKMSNAGSRNIDIVKTLGYAKSTVSTVIKRASETKCQH